MTETLTKDQILAALKGVKGPDLSDNIVSLGLVSEVVINKGKVYFAISVDPARATELEGLRQAAATVVEGLPGVTSAMVTLTADREPGSAEKSPVSTSRAAPRPAPAPTAAPTPASAKTPAASQPPRQSGGGIPGIRRIIAVASGKGGVGKSTTAVNIALALKDQGLKVGILDADIYGPSLPRLLGLSGQPQQLAGNKLDPMRRHGVKVMSMGFLVDEETPMIWRGPMVISAISQMLKDVAWGELDVLVVDMPPGTGDAQLTMAQQVPLAGAVIVSTPQDLALIDARKGLNMFTKVNVPVLGIVENMSTFICPHCGGRSDIFGHGGAKEEAKKLGVPFLGEVPLTMAVRETSDSGEPVVASDPDSEVSKAYRDIARTAWAEIERASSDARPAPKIVMEN
ncbi:iron-sulfur cluster carrier protein ApbC [Methyloceanibacter caenitepidi]|uniref:Iron-sulfur cluster carrier protein n=1 Tax=Methyloceanibacter caenitepidi TaxID=1384459 RepID=A0A0A8JZP2_9HYPH|nr:iron-sulfur cluster carrier protein ApbC [Methyloceanibacter caenitepidi]BAQ16283.1 scaffold protein for [4Fe-4S] cluster assembly ApbC, MRP-like [Methyloceanibacter caenitepidi]